MVPSFSKLITFLEPAMLGSFFFLMFQHTPEIESHWVRLDLESIAGLRETRPQRLVRLASSDPSLMGSEVEVKPALSKLHGSHEEEGFLRRTRRI